MFHFVYDSLFFLNYLTSFCYSPEHQILKVNLLMFTECRSSYNTNTHQPIVMFHFQYMLYMIRSIC